MTMTLLILLTMLCPKVGESEQVRKPNLGAHKSCGRRHSRLPVTSPALPVLAS